jgi:hypothetical protein
MGGFFESFHGYGMKNGFQEIGCDRTASFFCSAPCCSFGARFLLTILLWYQEFRGSIHLVYGLARLWINAILGTQNILHIRGKGWQRHTRVFCVYLQSLIFSVLSVPSNSYTHGCQLEEFSLVNRWYIPTRCGTSWSSNLLYGGGCSSSQVCAGVCEGESIVSCNETCRIDIRSIDD